MAVRADELFTDRAYRALEIAQQEAARQGSGFITTGHLLIGLASGNEGTAIQLLRAAKLGPESVRQRMGDSRVGRDATARGGNLSIGAEMAVQHAHREAKMEACRRVGTEHLLVGLIEARETVASQVLNDAGLKLSYYRQHLQTARQLAKATSAPGYGTTGGQAPVGGGELDVVAAVGQVGSAAMAPRPLSGAAVTTVPTAPSPPSAAPARVPVAAEPAVPSEPQVPPVIGEILRANEAFAAAAQSPAPHALPKRRLAVLTCIDCRLTGFVEQALGISRGDALVIRTAGASTAGRDDVIRNLCIAVYLQGVEDVVVLGHTDCALTQFNASDFLAAMGTQGVPRSKIDNADLRGWIGALSPEDARNVRTTVEELRRSELLPSSVRIHGMLLQTATGKIDVVC